MKNINRDYLVTVNARTAEIKAPKDMKFFMTDEHTSNIFFQLVFEDLNDESINSLINNHAPEQNADDYTLTLRVVKSNNEPKTISVERLDKDSNFFIADLTVDFVDIPGIYDCELFIDTEIADKDGILRLERSTTESFEYEVKESIFYNLDDVIDNKYISIEDIATKDYVERLVTGDVSLDGYATQEHLNHKADREHTHDEYITQNQLDETLAEIDCSKLNLEDFVVSNSISINRSENSVIGQYSTAEGDNTVATGHASHAEGYNTIASGRFSHAEGNKTKASSYSSHAEGSFTVANYESAHAEGYCTEATGYASHSEGYHTIASGKYQHVQGKYNISDNTVYAHIVGNGSDKNNLSNAHTLDWDGNAWFAGNVSVGDNKVLATREYVDFVMANGSGDGYDYIYDDTELRNSIAELEDAVEKKADKKIEASKYDGVNNINFGNIGLDGEYSGNRRQIMVSNPSDQLRIELPEDANVDFAEVHVFIAPIDNDTVLSIDINGDVNHSNLKYQDRDDIPTVLEMDNVYEFIFTYVNYGNDSSRWLVGAIIYE